MAKKILWAVAGVAVVVIAVMWFTGFPPVNEGTEATIGGANRYRGAQPASVDAAQGDVQKFLQSDTFDKIMKNPEVRGLLADAAMRRSLAEAGIAAALRDEGVENALQQRAVSLAVADAGVRAALLDPEARAALSQADLQRALGDEDVIAALKSPEWAEALARGDSRALVFDPDLAALAGNKAKLQAFFAEAEAALAKSGLRTRANLAAGERELFASLHSNPGFAALIAQRAMQQALRGDGMRALLGNANLAAAALRQGGPMEALLRNQSFLAAVEESALAMRASLQARESAVKAAEAGVQQAAVKAGDRSVFLALFDNAAMHRALQAPDAALVFANANLSRALADADFVFALRQDAFGRAVASADFEAAMNRAAGLREAR